ncbi:MAG: hypothetical protein IIB17_00485 [Chloroflexi bacterium]|nr:hypothetical protein [Chloroflexota bacterium]
MPHSQSAPPASTPIRQSGDHHVQRSADESAAPQAENGKDRPVSPRDDANGTQIVRGQTTRIKNKDRAAIAESTIGIESERAPVQSREIGAKRQSENSARQPLESDNLKDTRAPSNPVGLDVQSSRSGILSVPPVDPTTRRGAARSEDRDALPPRVYISRVEVRNQPPPPPANERKPRRRAPALSLDDYLTQRKSGR